MIKEFKSGKSLLAAAGGVLALSAVSLMAFAGPQDTGERRFWPPDYRPAPKAAAPAKAAKPRYKAVTPLLPNNVLAANPKQDAVMGITIWRLRESKAGDEARVLIRRKDKSGDMTPERVEAGSKFKDGERLRLSVEIPRNGYLYIINREQYTDGSMSDPYLIYPADPAGSENRVTAGRVVEIPSQNSQESLEVSSLNDENKRTKTAELLTMIVTPQPLPNLPKVNANDEPPKLPQALVESWEKQWGAQVEQLELDNGAGRSYTKSEQKAGATAAGRLTRNDPTPQTIFRVAAKPGTAFLIKLPLTIAMK